MGATQTATAQSAAQRPRGDAAGYIAWLAARHDPPTPEFLARGWEDAFSGGLSVGLYWTDHWKTEIDFGSTSTADTYYSRPIVIDGFHNFQAVRSSVNRRTVGLGSQYQFFRNEWFHPHVGAGINLVQEQRTDRFEPLFDYRAGPAPRLIREGRIEGPATHWTVRPFATTGFKGYVTRRAFFRADLRLAFLGGLEESTLRAGFGVDW